MPWQNPDAFFVIVVGVVVAILRSLAIRPRENREFADPRLARQPGASCCRNRVRRGELDNVLSSRVTPISGGPYEVVWQNKHWDLLDRENDIRLTEQLRFTQNIASRRSPTGARAMAATPRTLLRKVAGEGERRPLDRGKEDLSFRPGGYKVIYCLDEEHSRSTGDMLDMRIRARRGGSFPHGSRVCFGVQARTRVGPSQNHANHLAQRITAITRGVKHEGRRFEPWCPPREMPGLKSRRRLRDWRLESG